MPRTGPASYKKALIRLLDRPGGRYILGKAATKVFSRAAETDIGVLHANGFWTRQINGVFFPDSLRFEYEFVNFDSWRNQAETCISQTKEFWFWNYQPKMGDVVIDVGAGRGEDMLAFSRAVGFAGRVVAIEAHPLSFSILKSFCRLNRLSNVTPIHAAVMEKTGTVRLGDSEHWIETAVVSGDAPGVNVPATTLEQVFKKQGLNEVAFLKMNIEGAERDALPGMAAVMPYIRKICIACHDFRAELGHGDQFRTRAFVERFLTDHGFTVASRANDPRDYVRDHLFGVRGSGTKSDNATTISLHKR